jgi:hypothetical protein
LLSDRLRLIEPRVRITDQADPVWGQVAEIHDGEFDGWRVTADRVDGSYRIARSVIEQVRTLSPQEKAKLTTWIVDQHRAGESDPMITSHTLSLAVQRRPLNYRQKVARFFLFLRSIDFGVGKAIRVWGQVDTFQQYWEGRLSAWLEVSEPQQLIHLMRAFEQEGIIGLEGELYRLSAEGLRRLDDLGAVTDTSEAFVAMWFSAEMEEAYTSGFEPAIVDNGYDAMRIDKKEHINKIDDEIIAEIRRSRFLVADFTSEIVKVERQTFAVPRGGVYYEAGFAQGIGIPVIWCVRSDCIDFVHFDTRQYAHIVWNNPEDLRDRLRNRIGAVIGPRGA